MAIDDRLFTEAVDAYIDQVVLDKKKVYHSDLEPFEVHAQKMRGELTEKMYAFYRAYNSGYKVLLAELDPSIRTSCQANPAFTKNFDQTEHFTRLLAEGKMLYQLLGLSLTSLFHLYDAACALLKKKEYDKAKDGFYFLVVIAPKLKEAWIGLTQSYLGCHQAEDAIISGKVAVELLPNTLDSYIALIRSYVAIDDVASAKAVCDKGCDYAAKNLHEPWAEALGSTLQEITQSI